MTPVLSSRRVRSALLAAAGALALIAAVFAGAASRPLPGTESPAAQAPVTKPAPAKPSKPPTAPASDQGQTVAAAWKRITDSASTGTVRNRTAALLMLASAGDRPETFEILQHAMDDSHPPIRQASANALGQMRAHEAIPRLRQALDDTAPAVRVAAARALWRMHDYSGSDLLIRIVKRQAPAEEAKLKQEWHQALNRVDNPSAVFLLALEQGIGFLPGPSFLAIPLFRDLTKDKAAPGRASAVALLAEQHTDAAREALEQALVDPEAVVRAAAAVALGKSERPEEIVQIAPLLHDRKPTVRLAAAVGIARLSPPGSGPMPSATTRP